MKALEPKYGRLTIIGEPYLDVLPTDASRRKSFVKTKCDCGNELCVPVTDIIRGRYKSCGCLRTLVSKHPLYVTLVDMKTRCYYKRDVGYKNYGGRGITVCDEWRNSADAFVKWATENGWKKGLQIDRINNDGNYEPSNCRWVTPSVNAQNTRRATTTFIRAKHIRVLYYLGRKSAGEIGYLYGLRPTAVGKIVNNLIYIDPDFPKHYLKSKHNPGGNGNRRWWLKYGLHTCPTK